MQKSTFILLDGSCAGECSEELHPCGAQVVLGTFGSKPGCDLYVHSHAAA